MNSVRGTYSYQLMQSQNALLRNTDVRSRNEYEITQAPNFDVLERTYKQLRS